MAERVNPKKAVFALWLPGKRLRHSLEVPLLHEFVFDFNLPLLGCS